MAWAEIADVYTYTKRTVSAEDIARAEAILSLVHGVVDEHTVGAINKRDLYFLKLATCYQTAWMLDNPDYFERLDMTNYSSDGQSVTFKADGLLLAPATRRAVKRLSWRGTRTLKPKRARAASGAPLLDPGAPIYDYANDEWRPL